MRSARARSSSRAGAWWRTARPPIALTLANMAEIFAAVVLAAPKLATAREAIGRLPHVASIEEIEGEQNLVCVVAFPRDGQPIIADISQLARKSEYGIEEIRVERGRLDEVFRSITTGNA